LFKTGFYETDITPALGMERPATYHKLFHTRIHDPLKVRACVLDNGTERLAIVGVDTCIIGRETVRLARDAVQAACGIAGTNILIAASHTHSGGPLWGACAEEMKSAPPFIRRLALEESISLNVDYERHVIRQIATAVGMADQAKKEARLAIGSGREDQAAFNRRFCLKNGKTVTHPGKGNAQIDRPAGPIDPEVGVIAAWDGDRLLGCIVNYACHATCHGAEVSADWIYYLEQTVRGVMGTQANVVFLNGASGDVTQVDNQSLRQHEFGEKWSRHVGTRVGAEVLKTLFTAEATERCTMATLSENIKLKLREPSPASLVECRRICEEMIDAPEKTAQFHFAKERLLLDYARALSPEKEIEIQALQIGSAVLLANPAEYFCQFGLDIKARSNFPHTFVVGLANGHCGYVPTEDAFDPETGGGYETVLSNYSNLEVAAGSKIREACLRLAEKLTPDPVAMGDRVEPTKTVWGFGALGPELD
jgi:hypothetical protein